VREMIRDLGQTFDPQFKSRKHLVELTLNGYSQARNVYVVDDFCCWFPGAQPMQNEAGQWKFTIPLYEGEYHYAFMIDGYKWLVDSDNLKKAKNPYGLDCSLFEVDKEMLETPTAKMDGKIFLRALYHDQTPRYLDVDKEYAHFKFRAKKNDVTGVTLIAREQKRSEKRVKMTKVWEDKHFEYYECLVHIKRYPVRYLFEVKDENATAYFSELGATYNKEDVREFTLTKAHVNIFQIPEWAKGAIFYQIFPDRFFNGDKNNDPPKVAKWGDKPKRNNFFGGDLQGIIQKLDYIESLGVNAIYLTPIFSSISNHKYDIYDYFNVDPHFGNNETLKSLVNEAHRRGIKIILDAVFHHTSDRFWAFEDILRNQEKSKYVNWYFIRKFPVKRRKLLKILTRFPLPKKLWHMLRFRLLPNYETFAVVPFMPKLNLLNSETAEYFMKVAEFWVREYDIDGWRFDVAFGIPFKFWKELRARLKQIKSDLYLLGEFGNGNSDPSAWVGPETFDAVMNYPLRSIILDFVVFESISVEEFHQRLMELLGKLPHKAVYSMYNLLGSHDTPRLLTICNGDLKKAKLAIFLQMMLPGSPSIYYGDEVGLQGGNDPDCRGTMEWDCEKWNLELIDHVKKLIKIRKKQPVLTTGKMEVILKDMREHVFIFKRKSENDQAIICINNGKSAKVIDIESNKPFMEALSGTIFQPSNGTLTITIPPKEGIILVEIQKFKSQRII
jgi:glycosidase